AVGLFPDTAGTTDSIPDLIIATCHPRIPDLGWRLEVFHNFAVEAAPRLEVLSWIEYEQQGFINLMFADADGDGLVDFLEMHPKLGSPLIEGPGGALEDLSITIWRSQKNGGFRDPLTLSASGQQPLGLTPIPFDSTRHSSPLFTAAFQKEVPASPTNPILPSGISLFQFNPLVPQSAIPKGALRGGPLQYLHQQPIVIDRGARVFYAILPEPDEPGVPGIGVLNLKAYLDFIAVSTSQRSGPVLHKGKQPARVGSAEFKRGKQTLDALGRVRSKAKAPRRQKPGA
ncbi:MAG: hypothetical protein ABIW76_19710, partial [Fibrobacteria bacterium]